MGAGFSPASAREGSRPDRCSEMEDPRTGEKTQTRVCAMVDIWGRMGASGLMVPRQAGDWGLEFVFVVLLSRVSVVAVVVLVSPVVAKYDSGGHRGESIGSDKRERVCKPR